MVTAVWTKSLPEAAARIRTEVFVQEQGFEREFDEKDRDAYHIVLLKDGEPAATGRIFPGQNPAVWLAGRIAVRGSERGSGLGSALMREIEAKAKALGAGCMEISAQTRARPFYEKQGYRAEGEEYLDEYCPHICMRKTL